MPRPSLFLSLVLAAFLCMLSPFVPAGEAQPPGPGDLLGSTGSVGASLIDIDPMTGAGTLRGALGTLGPVTEIEFRDDGVLFGTTGGGTSNVITIDPETGAETLVGTHPFGAINGLEFVGSTLYGSFFSAGGPLQGSNYELVTVDQTDGSLTSIGFMADYFPIRGLAYDAGTGTMYGAGVPVAMAEGLGDVLFTVDLGTAATTEIGPIGFFVGGIEFGPDGTLYGGMDSPGGTVNVDRSTGGLNWDSAPRAIEGGGSASLVSINPATGAGTAIGPTGFSAISGLAFVPGGATGGGGAAIVAIPTLSPLSLALLAALIAAAAFVLFRRRMAQG